MAMRRTAWEVLLGGGSRRGERGWGGSTVGKHTTTEAVRETASGAEPEAEAAGESTREG